MTEGSLVAPVESTRDPWTGSSLADGIEDLVVAIKSEDWVSGALAGAGLLLEAGSAAVDPFSTLLSNGLGWAMEYFEPLREVLDELTGMPDLVRSHVETWTNMANELKSMSEDLGRYLANDLSEWTGDAAEAYRALMANNVDAIGGLSAISAGLAAATQGAVGLVEMTREIVRDLIADLVARVVVWAAEALLVVTIPLIASQIVAAVVKWAGRILNYTSSLVQSITNLSLLLNE
jgi:uncharacterized protein YukE